MISRGQKYICRAVIRFLRLHSQFLNMIFWHLKLKKGTQCVIEVLKVCYSLNNYCTVSVIKKAALDPLVVVVTVTYAG